VVAWAAELAYPTEHTLQQSYRCDCPVSGRMFVAIFSSNMNRIQMVINAAVAAGRKIALTIDGCGARVEFSKFREHFHRDEKERGQYS